jgi:hypothetical protein
MIGRPSSRRARVAAAAMLFKPTPTPAKSSTPKPVAPASMPLLKLKLKGSPAAPTAMPAVAPAGAARTATAEALAASRPGSSPPSTAVPAPAVQASKGAVSTPPKNYMIGELRALVACMRSMWPQAFAEEPMRPLAFDAGKVISASRPKGVSNRDIDAAIRFYTGGDTYLETLAAEGSRLILQVDEADLFSAQAKLYPTFAAAECAAMKLAREATDFDGVDELRTLILVGDPNGAGEVLFYEVVAKRIELETDLEPHADAAREKVKGITLEETFDDPISDAIDEGART